MAISSLRVFKRNDCKYYYSSVSVDYLADPDHWYNSVLTCILHAVLSYLFLMISDDFWCVWTDLYFLIYLLILTYIWNTQTILSNFGGLITSSLTKYLGLNYGHIFLRQHLWTNCHTCCYLKVIEMLVLDQGLSTLIL